MARLSTAHGAGASEKDLTSINFTRMLTRLQRLLITPDPKTEERLRVSELEREKVRTNIKYANSLLVRLEQEAQHIKFPTKKQETQTELVQKRKLIIRLDEILREMSEVAPHEAEEEVSSEGEDLIGEDTPSEETEASTGNSPIDSIHTNIPLQEPQIYVQPTVTHSSEPTSTLRSRYPTSHTQEREDLFSTSTGISPRSTMPISTKESLLTHNRTEQEELTSSLLNMASALRASSQSFATLLENEKDILSGATAGMDKNEAGLQAASKKMGTLRSMTEGRGWWGRILMYAWIAGLAVIAILLVFVGPKFRF